MKTLWDLLGVGRGEGGAAPEVAEAPVAPAAGEAAAVGRRGRGDGSTDLRAGQWHGEGTTDLRAGKRRDGAPSMAERYEAITREMLREHDVRVRKWRTSMSGCAWEVHYASGRVSRLIEAPRPKGPMSCAIFLHEIGHHAIGFGRYRPRCLEEYYAWRFALEQMEARGVKVTNGVRKRMDDSMRYAVDKARRRGLRRLPAELARWAR